jgi:hypothetical protein
MVGATFEYKPPP